MHDVSKKNGLFLVMGLYNDLSQEMSHQKNGGNTYLGQSLKYTYGSLDFGEIKGN